MIWDDIDMDAIEADLDAAEAEDLDVVKLNTREVEDTVAILSMEIMQLSTALDAERKLRLSQADGLRKVADLEGTVHDLRAALSAAEAARDAAVARADRAEAEAKTLRAQLDALANPVRERPTSTLTPGSGAADIRTLLLGEYARQAMPPTSSRRTSG